MDYRTKDDVIVLTRAFIHVSLLQGLAIFLVTAEIRRWFFYLRKIYEWKIIVINWGLKTISWLMPLSVWVLWLAMDSKKRGCPKYPSYWLIHSKKETCKLIVYLKNTEKGVVSFQYMLDKNKWKITWICCSFIWLALSSELLLVTFGFDSLSGHTNA